MLEPVPINTTRMHVVERIENSPFPYSQLYDSLRAPGATNHDTTGAARSYEDLFFLSGSSAPTNGFTTTRSGDPPHQAHHHHSNQQRMLGTIVQVLERDDCSDDDDDSSSQDDELISWRPDKTTSAKESSRSSQPISLKLRRHPAAASRSSTNNNSMVRGDHKHSDRWNDKFNELRAFIQKHGHARVPVRYRDNLPLSKWAKRQRYQWKLKHEGKHSTMNDSREDKLDEVGFLWDIRMTVWEERYEELLQYKKKHGNCNVPITCVEAPKLGTWVKCQRRQWKLRCNGSQSSMTSSRIAKLDAVEFSWEAR